MNRAVIGLVLVAAACPPARADELRNYLIGPVLGIRLSGPPGDAGVLGVEGGIGWGPERINIGFEHRANRELYYLELDPWYVVGGSFGFGVDDTGVPHGIIGLWEGIPLRGVLDCPSGGFARAATLAVGIRYSGFVELYLTVKAGVSEKLCFN